MPPRKRASAPPPPPPPAPVERRNGLADLPVSLRQDALQRMRDHGLMPISANLWRVTPIPGGYELDTGPARA